MTVKHILLDPGEELNLVIKAGRVVQPDPSSRRYVLPAPYLSQWSPTAQYAPGDCGPACLAMAVHLLTDERPTVDEVSQAAGMKPGAQWTNFSHIAKAGRQYDLVTNYVRPLKSERIIEEIQDGNPIIALVKYDLLSTPDSPNQDIKFKGAHFVLIVGIQIGPQEKHPVGAGSPRPSIIFHDPDRLSGQTFGEFREAPWHTFMAAMGATSKTPGNSHNDQGMVIYG
jgi:hypothetical protein